MKQIAIILILLLSLPAYAERIIMTEEVCLQQGATPIIEENGYIQCIYPDTADAGKDCNKHEDCEGVCVAELTEEQYNKLTKEYGQHTFPLHGKCSAKTIGPACMPNITDDGMVDSIICE
jgi:hypothetical protein